MMEPETPSKVPVIVGENELSHAVGAAGTKSYVLVVWS